MDSNVSDFDCNHSEAWLDPIRKLDRIARQYCDSPIEVIFLRALFAAGWRPCFRHEMPDDLANTNFRFALTEWRVRDGVGSTFALLQPNVLSYRLDFAFVRGDLRINVELDGFAFHDRTPDQAASDRSRDRLLTANGWRVLRFTGSEINRSPELAVREVYDVLYPDQRSARSKDHTCDVALERMVLGFVLANGGEMLSILAPLKPRDFSYPPHRLIFESILRLDEADAFVNQETVANHLEQRGCIRGAGGSRYLRQLIARSRHNDAVEDGSDRLMDLTSKRPQEPTFTRLEIVR